MHAVVVRVKVEDVESGREHLNREVVPSVQQIPGFVAGYWLEPTGDSEGLSVVVFDSESTARATAERVPQMLPADVTLLSNEVREVVASA